MCLFVSRMCVMLLRAVPRKVCIAKRGSFFSYLSYRGREARRKRSERGAVVPVCFGPSFEACRP